MQVDRLIMDVWWTLIILRRCCTQYVWPSQVKFDLQFPCQGPTFTVSVSCDPVFWHQGPIRAEGYEILVSTILNTPPHSPPALDPAPHSPAPCTLNLLACTLHTHPPTLRACTHPAPYTPRPTILLPPHPCSGVPFTWSTWSFGPGYINILGADVVGPDTAVAHITRPASRGDTLLQVG